MVKPLFGLSEIQRSALLPAGVEAVFVFQLLVEVDADFAQFRLNLKETHTKVEWSPERD